MIKGRFIFNKNGFRYRLEAAAKGKAIKLTQALVNGCIKDSPVFTGSFRASWNVSEGAPVYLIVDGGSEDAPLPPPRIKVKAATDWPVFYVTNGQPYANVIENGSSKQAPHGVLRVNVARFK